MFRRVAPGLVALSLLLVACGNPASTPASSGPAAARQASPVASPQGPTPTAMLALPAASPSPLAEATPSPVALAGASPSPVAVAGTAASPSPVAAGAPTSESGVLYRVIPGQSEARYEVQEKFVERPLPNQAVGRTTDVTGEIELEAPGTLRGRVLQMRVDLRTLTSDSARRDNFIRQNTLQSDQFPFAEFRSTEVAGPSSYTEGTEASFQIPGVMTIKGRERPLVWDATARLEDGRLTGTATARIKLSDFGVEAPRLAILSVEDDMTWVVQIEAERVP